MTLVVHAVFMLTSHLHDCTVCTQQPSQRPIILRILWMHFSYGWFSFFSASELARFDKDKVSTGKQWIYNYVVFLYSYSVIWVWNCPLTCELLWTVTLQSNISKHSNQCFSNSITILVLNNDDAMRSHPSGFHGFYQKLLGKLFAQSMLYLESNGSQL